ILSKLLLWLRISRLPMSWSSEIHWAIRHMKGKCPKAEMYRSMLAAAIYHVRKERNQRIFQWKQARVTCIIKKIIQEVHTRAATKTRLANWLLDYNCYPV
ncbi:hypothetical protein HAX54_050090, partial [Datura stramonium]|nr:hypothetical protein [Datura stramonium]